MARPRIVVVDDDLVHLTVLQEVLEDEGYAVATLDDLSQGYGLVKVYRPTLVILDLVQERRQLGLEVIAALQADIDTRDLPILITSADSQAIKEHPGQFRDVGIAALEKPYNFEDLLVLIRERVPTDAGAAQF